jgi:hypothetical protein
LLEFFSFKKNSMQDLATVQYEPNSGWFPNTSIVIWTKLLLTRSLPEKTLQLWTVNEMGKYSVTTKSLNYLAL